MDGDACGKLRSRSEEHLLHPHFTFSEEQEETRSCIRHKRAETFCTKTFSFLKSVLFDATGGKRACDRLVAHSHSSFCSHTPSADEFHIEPVNVLKQKPCLCSGQQKSLCKHYLLSAQYRFSVCNKPLCCLVFRPEPRKWVVIPSGLSAHFCALVSR